MLPDKWTRAQSDTAEVSLLVASNFTVSLALLARNSLGYNLLSVNESR
jgi:hypothetical protein